MDGDAGAPPTTAVTATPDDARAAQIKAEVARRGLGTPAPPGNADRFRQIEAEARSRGLLPNIQPTNIPTVSDVTKQAGPIINSAQAATQAAIQRLRIKEGYDPDVDYDTGLNFMDRMNLERADNEGEKKLYLEKRYGKENVGKDSRGTLWVKIDGKKISAEDQGLLATMAGDAPELTGATAGAVAGGRLGPGGALVGAALGAAGGKAADEIEKHFTGTSNKDFSEEMAAINKEGAMALGGEAAARTAASVMGRLTKGPLPGFISGATPESKELTDLTLSGGAVPPIKSALPTSMSLRQRENISRQLAGPFNQEKNQEFVDKEIKSLLRQSGVPRDQIDAVFKEITDPKAAISTTELGKQIQGGVRAYVDALETATTKDIADAKTQLEGQLKHLNVLISKYGVGDTLGLDVAKGITDARKGFATAAEKVYQRVDKIVGDEALVPTAGIKREAQKIYDQILRTKGQQGTAATVQRVPVQTPRGIIYRNQTVAAKPAQDGEAVIKDARVTDTLKNLMNVQDNISFKEAQRLRTQLRELSEMTDLTPTISQRNWESLRRSVDIAFGAAASNPKAAAGIKMLKAADKFYREGIQKFEDTTANKLVKMAETGIAPDASEIAKTLIKPGYKAQAERVLHMLPPEVRAKVAAADFGNITKAATSVVDGQEVVSGAKLMKIINDRGKLLDITYGPVGASQIRKYAMMLAAVDRDIPASALTPGTFRDTIERIAAREAELNGFKTSNFLAALADPRKMPDDVLRTIVRPRQEERLKIALKFFGENSPQAQAIRQMALKTVLRKAVINTETGVGRGISGEGIQRALSDWTHEQQELLFPNGLADDMRLVAKEVSFLFPNFDKDLAGGLIAGGIKAAMPLAFPLFATKVGEGWILSRPNVVRALALGLKGGGPIRNATRESMKMMIRELALTSTPGTEGSEEP